MKKLLMCLLLIFLYGCGVPTSYETVNDVTAVESPLPARDIQVTFPGDTAVETMESQAGMCYLCDSYTVSTQVLPGGNLDESLRVLTGLSKDGLMLMKTKAGQLQRYDTVWTSASESGDQTGRLTILDDGNYHYAVTVMADAAVAGDLTEQWNTLLDSIQLVSIG